MSDYLKRISCRALFFVFCLLPTAVVIQWILTPATTADWEARIHRALGLVSHVKSTSTPLPNQTILSQLVIVNNDTSKPVELGQVSIWNTEQNKKVQLRSLRIQVDSFFELISCVQSHIRPDSIGQRNYELSFGESVTLKELDSLIQGRRQKLFLQAKRQLP